MRFSAAIQPTAPRRPLPVQPPAPPREGPTALHQGTVPPPVPEVPPDLDQRVRLTGEW